MRTRSLIVAAAVTVALAAPATIRCGAVRCSAADGSGGVRPRRPVVLRGTEPDFRAGEHGDLVRWQPIETSFGQTLPDHVPLPDRRRHADGGHRAGRRVRRPAPVRRLPAAALRPRHDRDGRCVCTIRRHRRPHGQPLRTAPSSSRLAHHRTTDGSSWRRTTRASAVRARIRCSSASAKGAACSTPDVPHVRSPVSTSPHRRRSPDSPQGGHAALWAAQLAAEWTPEQQIIGTVVGAPASEPAALASWAAPQPERSALSVGLVAGLADDLPGGAGESRRRAHSRRPRVGAGVGVVLLRPTGHRRDTAAFVAADPATVEPFASLLAANIAGATATPAPLLIFHSEGRRAHPDRPQRGAPRSALRRRAGLRAARAARRVPRQRVRRGADRRRRLAQRPPRRHDNPNLQLPTLTHWSVCC